MLGPDSAMLALQAKFDEQHEAFEAYKIANVKKRKFLDTGANVSILSDITHKDINSIALCRRAEDAQGVATASGVPMEIMGSANFEGVVSKICTEANHSLLSVSQYNKVKNAVMIFDEYGAWGVRNSDVVKALLKEIKDHSYHTRQLLLTATMSPESLYEITTPHVPVVPIPSHPLPVPMEMHTGVLLEPLGASADIAAAVTCDTADWTPSEMVLEQHKWAYGAYYHLTADLPRIRDLVRFFHEAWDHPSCDLMCKIVDKQMLTNIPKELTAKQIRKYFPACKACSAGNLAQKTVPTTVSGRVFVPGEEFMVDIKVWANNSKALKHRRAFGKFTGAMTAVDLSTSYKIGKLLKTTSDFKVQLEELRVEIHGTGHTLKVLRIDNQFNTAAIKAWAAKCEPCIALQPCIPHEHHSIGDIERFHRTLEDAVFKKLYGKPHLTAQYWGMAYTDHIMKCNMIGSVHGPTACPYELWHGRKPDLLKLPMIPFGSVVMAHIPVAQQTVETGRSTLHYAVGTAQDHQGGLLLFNPKTKRDVIRRTYKILGPAPQPYTQPEYEISAECEVKETSVSVDTSNVSGDIDAYQYRRY